MSDHPSREPEWCEECNGLGHSGINCPFEIHECDECGEEYDETKGDGYCGLCPACADGPDPEAIMEARWARQEDDFNARWPR